MGVRVEVRWTDDGGEGRPRFHVMINGNDCGPSVPCSFVDYQAIETKLKTMLMEVCDKAHSVGRSDTQFAIRRELGVK